MIRFLNLDKKSDLLINSNGWNFGQFCIYLDHSCLAAQSCLDLWSDQFDWLNIRMTGRQNQNRLINMTGPILIRNGLFLGLFVQRKLGLHWLGVGVIKN